MIDSKAMRMKGTNCWWARQDLNLGPTDYEPISVNSFHISKLRYSTSRASTTSLILLSSPFSIP
jgi:hypothetical protein